MADIKVKHYNEQPGKSSDSTDGIIWVCEVFGIEQYLIQVVSKMG